MSDRRKPGGPPHIPQFDDTTNPQSNLDRTVDIPIEDIELVDDETINLPAGSLRQSPSVDSSSPSFSPYGRVARQDETIQPRTIRQPPSSSSSPTDARSGPHQARPEYPSGSMPSEQPASPKQTPWWAFWKKKQQAEPVRSNTSTPWWALGKKYKEVSERRKQMTQTGEMKALQWDEKTQPKVPLPSSSPNNLAAIARPSTPPPSQDISKPERVPPNVKSAHKPHVEGGVAFWVWTLLWTGLAITYSIPLWLTSWPPIADLPAQIGLLQHASQAVDASATLPWEARSLLYVGLLSDVLLSLWLQWIPASLGLSLLMQCWMVLTLLSVLFMLSSAGRPRWNALVAFPFLYAGALFQGDLHFFFALPFVIFGIGALYRWLALQQSMFGLLTMGVSWLLLFLHLEAYLIFLVASGCACFILGRAWGDRLYSLVLPGSSLLLLVPWIAVVYGDLPTSVTAATMGPLRPRVLGIWDMLTLGTSNGWSDVFNLALVLLVWAGVATATSVPTGRWASSSNHPTETPQMRAFFPILSLCMLVLYLVIPQSWNGFGIVTATPLVVMMMAWVGWVHITPQSLLGRFLIAATVVVSGGYGYHLLGTYQSYAKETSQLQAIIRQIPERRNLLVWSPPTSRVLKKRYHQAGGYYMFYRNGVSNLDLKHHLKWRRLRYHKKHRAPSPLRTNMPRLGRWQYILTGQQLPKALQPHLRLFVQSGPFRIYRRVQGPGSGVRSRN